MYLNKKSKKGRYQLNFLLAISGFPWLGAFINALILLLVPFI